MQRTDAKLVAVLVAPYGQRRTPEAAAAEVPVVKVLKPVAKSPCTSAFGLPVNCFVQFHHPVLAGRRTYEPTIERIVKYRFVGAPAVVGVLDVASGVTVPCLHVDVLTNEVIVKVVNYVILALKVDNGALVALLVDEHDGRHAGLLSHVGVVGTEVRGDVHNARTVVGGDVVAGDYAERAVRHRTYHRQQLLVVHAYEVCALVVRYYLIRYYLVAFLI